MKHTPLFPDDVWSLVFRFLTMLDHIRVNRTSQAFKAFARSPLAPLHYDPNQIARNRWKESLQHTHASTVATYQPHLLSLSHTLHLGIRPSLPPLDLFRSIDRIDYTMICPGYPSDSEAMLSDLPLHATTSSLHLCLRGRWNVPIWQSTLVRLEADSLHWSNVLNLPPTLTYCSIGFVAPLSKKNDDGISFFRHLFFGIPHLDTLSFGIHSGPWDDDRCQLLKSCCSLPFTSTSTFTLSSSTLSSAIRRLYIGYPDPDYNHLHRFTINLDDREDAASTFVVDRLALNDMDTCQPFRLDRIREWGLGVRVSSRMMTFLLKATPTVRCIKVLALAFPTIEARVVDRYWATRRLDHITIASNVRLGIELLTHLTLDFTAVTSLSLYDTALSLQDATLSLQDKTTPLTHTSQQCIFFLRHFYHSLTHLSFTLSDLDIVPAIVDTLPNLTSLDLSVQQNRTPPPHLSLNLYFSPLISLRSLVHLRRLVLHIPYALPNFSTLMRGLPPSITHLSLHLPHPPAFRLADFYIPKSTLGDVRLASSHLVVEWT